jgi:uncharacterized protein (TIGR00369 family)
MSASDAAQRLQSFLERVPYIQFLGMRAELAGDEMTAILPYRAELIGNQRLPALHGGVLGAFMEMTALAQFSVAEAFVRIPKTIDITVEYLRPGRPMTTFARAELRKVGRRIANIHVEAWQEERASPICALRGHFLLTSEGAPPGR